MTTRHLKPLTKLYVKKVVLEVAGEILYQSAKTEDLFPDFEDDTDRATLVQAMKDLSAELFSKAAKIPD